MNQLRPRQYTTQSIPKNSPQSAHFIQQPQQPPQVRIQQPPPQQPRPQPTVHIQPSLNNPLVSKIHIQISHIQQINRQLLSISQKIKSINNINSKTTSVPIIDKVQADFSYALNQLIQNIMQFHTDIDVKLINLGHFVEKQFGKVKNGGNSGNNSSGGSRMIVGNGLTQNQMKTMIQQSTDAKYQVLAQRIRGLEVSLRETQLNQKKLIQVIQNMMQRYQVNDQPTLIRQSPSLQNQFRRNRAATSATNIHYNRQQRSQSKKTTTASSIPSSFVKPENKNKSIYQNLYTIQQSVVNQDIIQPDIYGFNNNNNSNNDSRNNLHSGNQMQQRIQQQQQQQQQQQPQHFRLRQIQQQQSAQNQTYIKKLYSKHPAPTNLYQNQSKKSLKVGNNQPNLYASNHNSVNNKQEKSTASQSSYHDDKQHRLNFMMGKLNL